MKLRAALLSLGAVLGGCPLLNAVDLSKPLCRSSDLAPSTNPELMPDEAVVVVVCEAGRTTTRDARGQVYTRSWTERMQCDLHNLADAPRSVALRSCVRSR